MVGKQHQNSDHDSAGSLAVVGPAGAQTLVLLGEAGLGAATWNALVGPLAEQFRIVRPNEEVDHKQELNVAALGQSAMRAMDAVGCARAHVAGSGLGGLVALWLAIHHPERVARIAVIGASAKLNDSAAWISLAARLRKGDIENVANDLVRGWLTPALRERDAALVKNLAAAIMSHEPATLAGLFETAAEIDLRQDIGRVAAPVLVLSGEEDAVTNKAALEELRAALPQATLETIPQSAHLVTVEQPARVAKGLLDHFGSAASLEAGFRSRRIALGDPHVDKTIAAITPFTRSFQDFLTRYCWGEVWTRAGLSRRDRSMVTIAALVAIGAEHEIPVHVRAGLRHGLKIEEFPELYEHLALYTGLPRAFGALNVTQRTLVEDGLLTMKPAS